MVAMPKLKVTRRSSFGNGTSPMTMRTTLVVGHANVRKTSPADTLHVVTRPVLVVVATTSPPCRIATPITQWECSSLLSIEHEAVLQMIAVWSKLPVRILPPSGKILATSMSRSCPRSLHTGSPVVASQTVASLSKPQVSTPRPSGNTSTPRSMSCMTTRSPAPRPVRSTAKASPEATSQTTLVPSSVVVTTRSLAGKRRAHSTGASWRSTCSASPVAALQTMAVASRPHVRTMSPRGKKRTPVISAVWPRSIRCGPPGPHKVTERLSEQMATKWWKERESRTWRTISGGKASGISRKTALPEPSFSSSV
mmetsp:Transcript_5519/g.15900  ORF Transcript_5519/g.15900 Transcript_5519/m.15900 type:complete len:310 (+) Transcript_5519:397-1326(+)